MVVVSLPAAPHAPVQVPRAAWWRYLERSHAHEVLAQWRPLEATLELRETCPSAPELKLSERLPITQPWELRVALWMLACRLTALGAYWGQRSTDGHWRPLARPAGAFVPDLRKNAVIDIPQAPVVHHYHDDHGGGDKLLAALTARGKRFVVLRAQLDVPSLDIGKIDILHPHLPSPMMRSLVLREQQALGHIGMSKLVTRSDYLRAFGDEGEHRAARLIDEVVTRVNSGQLERPVRQFEESEEYAEFLLLINDPRLRALHKRFLSATEESELMVTGPVAIGKWISQKRTTCDHTVQHLLTVLEASLLAREKIRNKRLMRGDPEIHALTHLAYYL